MQKACGVRRSCVTRATDSLCMHQEETVKRYMSLVLVALLAIVAAQAGATNLIQNGSFQTGDFTGWTIGTTSNGTWGSGLPVITTDYPFPDTNAAEGRVGEVSSTGLEEGGTLTQAFQSSGGAAVISMDWAAQGKGNYDLEGGEFTTILNGVQIAQHDVGFIGNGEVVYGSFTEGATLLNGSNMLEIEITRRFVPNASTPLQFVTGVDVEGNVPEPGSLVLMGSGVLGLAGVLRRNLF